MAVPASVRTGVCACARARAWSVVAVGGGWCGSSYHDEETTPHGRDSRTGEVAICCLLAANCSLLAAACCLLLAARCSLLTHNGRDLNGRGFIVNFVPGLLRIGMLEPETIRMLTPPDLIALFSGDSAVNDPPKVRETAPLDNGLDSAARGT